MKFYLLESGLSRVYQHIANADSGKRAYAILTAWKGDLPSSENKKRMHHLKKHLKSHGYSWTKMKGHGQEKDASGKMTVSKEPSLMVHGMSKKAAKKIGRKYRQYSVIWHGDKKGAANFPLAPQKKNRDPKMRFNHKVMGKKAKYFSTVKGRPFHFTPNEPFE